MLSCFQEIKGGSMSKILEDFASGLIKGIVKMNKKEKNQAFCIIFFCFAVSLLCYTIYQQNILISKYEKTLDIYKKSSEHISERLEEKHQNADALELYNKSAKERMRRYRERQKEKLITQKEENVTSPLRNALRNVTGIEEERRKKNKKEDIEYIPPPYIEGENEKKLEEEEEEKKILSKEEEEILKSYAYNADRPIYDYASWRKKVIENGNYKSIIKAVLQEKEAQKQEYTTRPDCQEYIPPEIVNLTEEDEQKIKEIQEQIKQRRRQNNGSNSTKN